MQARQFEEDFVEMQLRCCGLAAYKSLMEQGYPDRFEYKQILAGYNFHRICQRFELSRVEVFLQSAGINRHEYKLGTSRVCFRPLKSQKLEKLLHPTDNDIKEVKQRYEKKLKIFRHWSNIVHKLLLTQWVLILHFIFCMNYFSSCLIIR